MKLCLFMLKVCMHRLTDTDCGMCYCLFRVVWKGGVLTSHWQWGNCWEGSGKIGKDKCHLDWSILRQPHDFIQTCHMPSHYFGQKHSQGKVVVYAPDTTPTYPDTWTFLSTQINEYIKPKHTHKNCKPQWFRMVNAGTRRISGQFMVLLTMHMNSKDLPVLIMRNLLLT